MKNSLLRFSILLALLLTLMTTQAAAADHSGDGTPDAQLHLLLIGRDSRSDIAGRSDCMILCSLSPETGSITFTSFLRDLYVEIPGYRSNRLNAAYAFGGMELLKQTLENSFGLPITGCIAVDFSSFPLIIDTLGGVSLHLRRDEAEVINAGVPGSLTEGMNLLTGEQALAYSRIRKLDDDGDFSRSLRQRKLLTALLDRYRDADLLTVLSAVADTLPMLSSDLGRRQLLKLCIKLLPLLEDPQITSQQIPEEGSYTCETIRGMDVLVADMDALRSQLHQSLLVINENTY